MKRRLFAAALLLCLAILSGCTATTREGEYKPLKPVGQVPDGFKSMVENNLFQDVTAFDERVLKVEICHQDKENRVVTHRICMMDTYGKELASYTCQSSDAYHLLPLTVTEDGGFLFLLGFSDRSYGQDSWASDQGFASRIIKCHSDGSVQFDTALEGVEGWALRYCFEKDGKYYFFGGIQTPETKTRGVGSPTDVYMAILDDKGTLLKDKCIAGSDFDDLKAAELTDNGFLLSIRAQSEDGDFTGSGSGGYPVSWVFTVNEDLEILDKKKETGRESLDKRIGEKDGTNLYQSDALLEDFDGGEVTAFIDYGDSYLIVSENITGVYENTPMSISSIWHYWETVYSLYRNDGKLIFRACVDSSPDYDAILKEYGIG